MIWLHFVGGYYKRASFVAEAKRTGITRRIAPNQAKGITFGDVVRLATWGQNGAKAFGAFRIEQLTLNDDIAEVVTRRLKAEGRATLSDSGGRMIVRQCGSYELGPTWEVVAPASEVVELALAAADALGVKASMMVGGPLIELYDPPVAYPDDVTFFRGFKRLQDPHKPPDGKKHVTGVVDYRQRQRKHRKDIQLRLQLEETHVPA